MNYFSNKKIYVWALVTLVLLNIFSLSALFIQHKRTANFMMMKNRPNERTPRFDKIEHFMKKEIGFSDAQVDSFKVKRKAHSEAMQQLNMEIHKRKKQLMDGTFDETIDEVETQNLIREIGGLQTQIEEISQKQLLEMSRLCKPDQKEKFKHLMKEAMSKHGSKFTDQDHRSRKEKVYKNKGRDHQESNTSKETQ